MLKIVVSFHKSYVHQASPPFIVISDFVLGCLFLGKVRRSLTVCWAGSFRREPGRQSRGGQLPGRRNFPWGFGMPGAAEGQKA